MPYIVSDNGIKVIRHRRRSYHSKSITIISFWNFINIITFFSASWNNGGNRVIRRPFLVSAFATRKSARNFRQSGLIKRKNALFDHINGIHPYNAYYSTTTTLSMKNKKGKTIAKENLPSKVCVVCNRPFTWRKKWERVWDEVTTCSKSCNAKRKAMAKQQLQSSASFIQVETFEAISLDDGTDSVTSTSSPVVEVQLTDKQARRKQRKEAVKAQKQERRLKRMGQAPKDCGRKACDLCTKRVDLLIRCTIDESQTYKMVCGKCWQGVSGGMVDGNPQTRPHYRYGGLWKNRSAGLKKRVGDGSSGTKDATSNSKSKTSSETSTSSVLDEIQNSLEMDN